MPPVSNDFSKIASALIKNFEATKENDEGKKISVNILVSKVASYYEKLRTAMDYGNEETILRRAIERILKRRLVLEADSKALAEGLVRELVWAGYFADLTVPESIVDRVAKSIELFQNLKEQTVKRRLLKDVDVYELIIGLLSSEIDVILLPNKEKEAMSNFMFHVLKNSIEIVDDSKQTRDVQVYIAIRKNFDRDDAPFLRYKLFLQIFGKLSKENFEKVLDNFALGVNEIEYQLSYPKKDRVFNHIKKNTPPFLILYDLLMLEKGHVRKLAKEPEALKNRVFEICRARYKNVRDKITTAIIRSFIFILATKAFIALFVEGAFERLFYGQVQWFSIAINTTVPPLLMIFVGLFIQTPGNKNSQKIYQDVLKLLFEENPQITPTLSLKIKSSSAVTLRDRVFYILWLLSIILVFGIFVVVLTKLHLNPISQAVFMFFVAIISFLSYRIYQTANTYTVIFKQNITTPIIDFFFVPIIRVGRRFTEGIAQINFILIIIDFIIEMPFKGLVGFFEQWFSFLAKKREELE